MKPILIDKNKILNLLSKETLNIQYNKNFNNNIFIHFLIIIFFIIIILFLIYRYLEKKKYCNNNYDKNK